MTKTRKPASDQPNPNIERFNKAAVDAGIGLIDYDADLVNRFYVEGRSPSDLPEADKNADANTFG